MTTLSDSDRVAIRKVVEQRGIRRLLHFTRVENLRSIFAKGLVPQSDESVVRKLNNTDDGNRDCVCLSISHVSGMFYPMREDYPPDNDWCVVVLKPNILWEKTCMFVNVNAARKSVKELVGQSDNNEFVRPGALENMFAETIIYSKDEENSEDKQRNHVDYLQKNMVTDPQAEIRVRGTIEVGYMQEIHFHEKVDVKRLSDISWPEGIQRRKKNWFFHSLKYVMNGGMEREYLAWLNDPSS